MSFKVIQRISCRNCSRRGSGGAAFRTNERAWGFNVCGHTGQLLIDFKTGTLSINGSLQGVGKGSKLQRLATKTDESNRTIRVPGPRLDILRKQKERQAFEQRMAGERWRGNEWDQVFTTEAGTEPRNINRQIVQLLAKVGLPNIRFHDTRHTAAVLMLAQGIPLKVVSQVLRHSKIATTADNYAHVLPRQE